MGGKSKSSNNQQIAFEMQQAAEAKQKEADRQARLAQGTDAINSIFASGNFNDDFYNKYRDASYNFQKADLDKQHNLATYKLTTDLANAGIINSKAAGRAAGLVNADYLSGDAAIGASSDQQAAALRSQVQNEKQSAENQLFATEDPTVAANSATGMVQQASIATPNLNPLGAMFTPLIVGAGSALGNYIDSYNVNRGLTAARPGGSGAISTVPT